MKGWQNSIRHNLTLGKNKLFTKIDRDGKRSFWSLNPGVELSVSKKTTEKTKKASSKNTNKPQNMNPERPKISYKDLVILATLLGYGDSLITDEIGNFICEIFPYFATLEGPAKTKWKSSIRHVISVPAQESRGQLVEKEILSKVKLSEEEKTKKNAKGQTDFAYGMYF